MMTTNSETLIKENDGLLFEVLRESVDSGICVKDICHVFKHVYIAFDVAMEGHDYCVHEQRSYAFRCMRDYIFENGKPTL